MGDYYVWNCPTCHILIGGWNYSDPPVRCPFCGSVNLDRDGKSVWGEQR